MIIALAFCGGFLRIIFNGKCVICVKYVRNGYELRAEYVITDKYDWHGGYYEKKYYKKNRCGFYDNGASYHNDCV